MFWYFGPKACEILAPQPGTEPTPSAFKEEVLITEVPSKSLFLTFCDLLR